MRILRGVADGRPGRTFKCQECGTLVRTGQIHTAHIPRPHQTLEALVVNERAEALA